MNTGIFALVLSASALSDANVEDYVNRQQSTIGLLWAVEMEIEDYYVVQGNKRFTPPMLARRDFWAKDPRRERQRYEHVYGPGSAWENGHKIHDTLVDGKIRRTLRNWDPASRRYQTEIRSRKPHPVKGSIRPAVSTQQGYSLNPMAGFMLQAVYFPGASNRKSLWSIREFIEASPDVRLLPTLEEGDRKLRRARVHFPEGNAGVIATLYFDSSIGGMIRKQVFDVPKGPLAKKPFRRVHEIMEIVNYGNGIYIPKKVVGRTTLATGEVIFESYMTSRNIRVNDKVREASFDLRFPEDLIVQDLSDPLKVRFHLWGADNKPKMTVSDINDLPRPTTVVQSTSVWRAWLLPITCAIVVALVIGFGVVAYRRRQSK